MVSGQFLLDSESKLKEAIQKMIESKSGPATAGQAETKENSDSFFDGMDDPPKDDFFDDMK